MPYPWFRVYNSIIYDPKLRRLTMAQRWMWIGLLAVSSAGPTRGVLEIREGMPYTARDLALALCATPRQVTEALRQFLALGMINLRETPAGPLVAIAHWATYQYEASTARVQKHRLAKAQGRAAADEDDESSDLDDSEDADASRDGGDTDDSPRNAAHDPANDGDAPEASSGTSVARIRNPRSAEPPVPTAPRRTATSAETCSMKRCPETRFAHVPAMSRNAFAAPDTESDTDAEPDTDTESAPMREGWITHSLLPDRGTPGPPARAGAGSGPGAPRDTRAPDHEAPGPPPPLLYAKPPGLARAAGEFTKRTQFPPGHATLSPPGNGPPYEEGDEETEEGLDSLRALYYHRPRWLAFV